MCEDESDLDDILQEFDIDYEDEVESRRIAEELNNDPDFLDWDEDDHDR